MKKVFKGTSFFRALGFKKQILTFVIYFSVGLGLISITAAAPIRNQSPPTLKANAPNVYVVKKGDTLWAIAKKFLNNPLRWPEIWASNRYIKNPHWIFPGDRLLMCTYQGRPIIGKDEGDGCDGVIRRYSINKSQVLYPQVRIESLNNAIPIIPLEDIKQWLDRSFILPPDSLNNTPYIVGMADERVIAGAGQNVYARGLGLVIGQRYGIYAEGQPYILLDEQGNKVNAGLELTQVASGIAIQSKQDITTLEITHSYHQEIRKGYRVLPEHEVLYPTMFYPVYAEDVSLEGKVIRIHDSIGAAAKRSIVSIA